MRMAVKDIKVIIARSLAEARISASPEYLRNEKVRAAIQQAIASLIALGDVKDESDLAAMFSAADMSLKALKMVPLNVWNKLAKQRV